MSCEYCPPKSRTRIKSRQPPRSIALPQKLSALSILGDVSVPNASIPEVDVDPNLVTGSVIGASVSMNSMSYLPTKPFYLPIPTPWERCSVLPSVASEGAYMTSAFWNSFMFW